MSHDRLQVLWCAWDLIISQLINQYSTTDIWNKNGALILGKYKAKIEEPDNMVKVEEYMVSECIYTYCIRLHEEAINSRV